MLCKYEDVIADYEEKIKKKDGDMSIPLTRTTDILKYVGQNRKAGQVICGFAMETKDLIENATKKFLVSSGRCWKYFSYHHGVRRFLCREKSRSAV